MAVRVTTGARLHFGFLNLSLAHERLYGSLGVALESPQIEVTATKSSEITCSTSMGRSFVERAVDHLGVAGADVEVESLLPRHVGLGSGTQLALAIHTAIARAYDMPASPRAAAPALDRGGRSGVGVATFESGGFVLDAGHPVERFTTDRPPRGEWTVPAVTAQHHIPPSWRFVLVRPDEPPGRSDTAEEQTMRRVVETAAPEVADQISAVMTRRLLPAIATGDRSGFGDAVQEIGRLNGTWYADEQGGVYRPPVGAIVDALSSHPSIDGTGQSSWGPTVYGITSEDRVEEAEEIAQAALANAGVEGTVQIVRPRNQGASITTVPEPGSDANSSEH